MLGCVGVHRNLMDEERIAVRQRVEREFVAQPLAFRRGVHLRVGRFVAQTGQQHPLQSETSLRIFALVLDAIYFVGLWSTRGQTLAMQTWRIRVVTPAGERLSQGRALFRFAACCVAWLGVPVALAWRLHWPPMTSLLAVLAWFAIYPLFALFAPGRQFWHDRLCGTRLVVAAPREVRPRPR